MKAATNTEEFLDDESSSHSDGSLDSVDHEDTTEADPSAEESSSRYAIAEKETKQVFMQKLLVLAVLLVAATAICLTVYFITTNAEEEEFEAHFEGGAEKIVSSFEAIIQEKIGAIGSLCLALTARGKITDGSAVENTDGNSWPFVTMESFQERAASARILANVLHMSLLPIVTEENREAWEAYSRQNGEWYSEGFAYQQALLETGFSLQDADGRARSLREEYKMNENSLPPFKERDPRTRDRKLQTNATEDEFTLFVPKIYEYTDSWEIAYPDAEEAPFLPVWYVRERALVES